MMSLPVMGMSIVGTDTRSPEYVGKANHWGIQAQRGLQ